MCLFQSSFLVITHTVCRIPWVVSLVYSLSKSEFSLFNEMQRHIIEFMKTSRWTLFCASWCASTQYIILVYTNVLIWFLRICINVASGCWAEMQECCFFCLPYNSLALKCRRVPYYTCCMPGTFGRLVTGLVNENYSFCQTKQRKCLPTL